MLMKKSVIYSGFFLALVTLSQPAIATENVGAVMHLFNITEQSGMTGSLNSLKYPQAIFVDQKQEEIYVAAQQRMSIFNRHGFLLRSFSLKTKTASDKREVRSLVVDSEGMVYIWQMDENVLHQFNQRGNYLGIIKIIGLPDNWKELELKGIAIDKHDLIFCLDQANAVCFSIDTRGRFQSFFTIQSKGKEEKSQMNEKSRLADITISNQGYVIISDNGKREIHIYDQSGKLVKAFGGNWGGVVKFSQLTGIGVDEQDRIYAVDTLGHNISIFSYEGSLLYQFGGFGLGNGWFSFPSDITVQGHRVYVVDTNNNRIQVLETASSKLMANINQQGRRLYDDDPSSVFKGGRRRLSAHYYTSTQL